MQLKNDNQNNGYNNGYNNYYEQNNMNFNNQSNYNQSFNQNYNQNGYNAYNQNQNYYNNGNYNAYNQANQAFNMGNAYMASNNGGYAQAGSYTNADRISDSKFNLILGGCLFWGFLINCILCSVFADSIVIFALNSGIFFFVFYIVLVIVGNIMVNKSDNPVVSFIGYNLIVIPIGMVISIVLSAYVAEGYASIVPVAFGITAAVTLGMMLLSSFFPKFFASSTMGKTLLVTLLLTIVIELIMMFAGADLAIIDYIVVLIFCGYIGYDWARANQGVKTVDRAVDAAAMLYVDIANLFLRIMRILARARR